VAFIKIEKPQPDSSGLINLVDRRIEVYTHPTGPTEQPDYLQRQDMGPDDTISLEIAGHEVGRILVRDLLP